ncbi:MAG: prepilin peptidase [Oscillospiraceae bacterium]|jgi:leader peptidase (prepilin peptidase)/N-methyltransferase|nr:prepilin peptidase [Oscillospiraceae bacterium]
MLDIYISAWLFVLGSIFGSFLNVVVFRLPKKAFLSKARSYCPACGETIAWFDLIPVASWIALGGKCRRCKARISPRYPLVELFCGVLAPLCYLRYGFDWRLLIAFGVTLILLAVSLIDLDTMEIPDSLVIALVPFAAGAVWVWREVPLWERAVGLAAVSVPMLLLALLIEGAFGGGDIKLMAVCGFLLGFRNTLLAFMIALLIGGGIAIVLILTKRKKKGAHIPFGPPLCIGTAAALFFGTELITLYLGLYGL